MSSESVQQVRDRVLQLAREIEQLSKSQAPPDRFFEEFLQRLTAAVGAQAAAVWFVHANRLTLRSEIRLSETGLLEDPAKQQANERLLSNVISTGEAGTFSPEDSGENQSPTPHLLVLAALHCNKECVGVVELFQRADAPKEARPGYLQFLEQMCGLASKYLDQQHAAGTTDTGEFWQSFEQLVLRHSRQRRPTVAGLRPLEHRCQTGKEDVDRCDQRSGRGESPSQSGALHGGLVQECDPHERTVVVHRPDRQSAAAN